jgi:hypothetical protein
MSVISVLVMKTELAPSFWVERLSDPTDIGWLDPRLKGEDDGCVKGEDDGVGDVPAGTCLRALVHELSSSHQEKSLFPGGAF